MSALLRSVWLFVFGIVSRVYYWGFALLLDPLDLYGRFKSPTWPELDVPSSLGWGVLAFLVFWSAALTFHEVRSANQAIPSGTEERRRLRQLVAARDRFTIGELASLLAGSELTRQPLTGAAAGYYHDILKLVKAGKVHTDADDCALRFACWTMFLT